ncbi:hypothetical protein NA56DRAFT_644917 [Hyaloscypha hepaticicola]|uniref:Uncharacterized protein n=1 Tax=Hyaloscypha hepaticicola TaxID=2082293 RepID=A0A2J6Q7H0_9HELO|nr:hypothetical protein NA56DRAFT_644917 [Hyaloscypha hepaticicola]
MTVLAFGNCEGSGTIVDYSCVCIAVGGNEITAAVFYFAATSAPSRDLIVPIVATLFVSHV